MNYTKIKTIEEYVLLIIRDNFHVFKNDIRLYTMLAFASQISGVALTDEDIEGDDFLNAVDKKIQPEFDKLMENEEYKKIFDEIVEDVYNYCKSKQEDDRHLTTKLDKFVDLVSQVDPEQLVYILSDLTTKIAGENTIPAPVDKDNINAIENEKLKDLINKYKTQTAE